MDPIYLDHNATTPLDPEALEAMLPYLREEFGNPSSGHPYGQRARAAVEKARAEVAALIGAEADEIIFTSGGTEASQLALLGTAEAMRAAGVERPLRFLTFALEHSAILRPLDLLRERGEKVVLVPANTRGEVDLSLFLRAIESGEPPDLISLMHAHNETGVVQPAEEIGRAARARSILYHLDAAQTMAKLPVDVKALGCDLLSIAGHKLYGPKGVGALYARRGTPLLPQIRGAGQEAGRRAGTENVAGCVGLGAACRIAARRMAEGDPEHLASMRDRLWEGLRARIPGIVRTGEGAAILPNTLHLRFPGATGLSVLRETPEVAASTGSACHSGSEEPPEAIVALGIAPEDAIGSVRLSVGHKNTPESIDAAVGYLVRGWERAQGGNRPGGGR